MRLATQADAAQEVAGQGNLRAQRRLMYLMWVVLGIPKHNHLPKAELYWPQNAISSAMVQVGGWQHVFGNSTKDKANRPGRDSFCKSIFGETSTSSASCACWLLNRCPLDKVAQSQPL